MNLRSVLQQLRERCVWRALTAYAVTAFVIVQVADATFEPLGLPSWSMALVVSLALLGAPIVAVMSWVFDWEGGGLARARRDQPRRYPAGRSRVAFGIGGLALLAAVALAAFGPLRGGEDIALDPSAVAVLPFTTAGAGPSLEYLGEGMPVLLGSLLSGDGGLRAVDSRSSIATAAQVSGEAGGDGRARQVAERLGAGRWLAGDVVGTESSLILTARLGAVGSESPASAMVTGPADSLPALVEELAVALISQLAGEERERIRTFQRVPLAAVRAYLDGHRAFRTGDYTESNRLYRRALDADSTFVHAALGLAESTGWAVDPSLRQRALALAWNERERLSARDEALLMVEAGARYPDVTPAREALASAEALLRLTPDRPHSAYKVGDILYHYGDWLGEREAMERARRLFERALELDPGFVGPLQHLMDMHLMDGDSAAARTFAERFAVAGPESERMEYVRFILDELGGSNTDAVRARVDSMSHLGAQYCLFGMSYTGVGAEHLDALRHQVIQARPPTSTGDAESWYLFNAAMNLGRSDMVEELMPAMMEMEEGAGARWLVRNALYWDGDPELAARAVALVESRARPFLARGGELDAGALLDRATVEAWRLHHGDASTYPDWTRRIAELAPVAEGWSAHTRLALTTVDLTISALEEATRTRPQQPHPRLASLDSIIDELPLAFDGLDFGLMLTAARVSTLLHDQYGQHEAALRSARRRFKAMASPVYRSSFLRDEGRLAALTGDREGAVEAYRRFLALRPNPRGAGVEQTEAVRAALAALVEERAR